MRRLSTRPDTRRRNPTHRGLDSLRRNGWKGHGPVPREKSATCNRSVSVFRAAVTSE
ncbi:DUF3151 domain-containing protein [Streptomyces sp. NBC_00487]|nr:MULTISPECIES: DUF3151 family protein [unclassified Streptomyces]WRY96770.1 DUF3151 domain-containing protein [Streptomyces sp. NBC_00481]